MRYMLDTNICIYLMNASPPSVQARMAETNYGDAVISVVTYAELRAGIETQISTRARNQQILSLLLRDLPVLPFDMAAAENYGVMRIAVRDRKRDTLDRLIAAHAVSSSLVLVTNNLSDFAGYPGLIVENWL
jgi:tRNA(fMet)-specific endonuclease VapC